MKKSRKCARGITLVALVITIIILLILAGISIQALTNQGLFTQAQNAKNLTEEKTAEENAILTNYLEQMNAIIGGQVTESVPDGAVVTPINDITTWLKTGGISKQYSYTTIEQVIADTTCTESLINNENAMKYLARSTEFADAICASETAMTYLGKSAYVDDTVLNSDSWATAIKSSQYWSLVFASKTINIIFDSSNATTTKESSVSLNGNSCYMADATDIFITTTLNNNNILAVGNCSQIEVSMDISMNINNTNSGTNPSFSVGLSPCNEKEGGIRFAYNQSDNWYNNSKPSIAVGKTVNCNISTLFPNGSTNSIKFIVNTKNYSNKVFVNDTLYVESNDTTNLVNKDVNLYFTFANMKFTVSNVKVVASK